MSQDSIVAIGIAILTVANAWGLYLITSGTRAREKLRDDLNSFRVEVAQRYVTSEAMKVIEERLISAIERLGDRLDKVVTRAME